jgi:hypothetical protein
VVAGCQDEYVTASGIILFKNKGFINPFAVSVIYPAIRIFTTAYLCKN